MKVQIPNHAWYEDEPLTLEFPDEWEVKRCKMACEGQSSMTPEQIKAAIHNPIGTKPLREMAGEAEEAVIIFDDMTRPTKTHQYAPVILETLRGAGVPQDNIRFIIAAGTHGTFGRMDFVKKLGEEIVGEYPVYNHNPYEMLVNLGETSYGTPVWLNEEVSKCDLKIAIGTVLFHRLTGFSGGGKIISPGVVGIKTIHHNHGPLGGFGPGFTPHETTGYMMNESNVMRLDAEETARMAGLDFKIDTVLNLNRDPSELYAGDFVQTQRWAAKSVKRWHATESPEADIVVVGSYMRENEPGLGFWPAYNSVKDDGTIVLIANDPDSDINHWLFHNHGKTTGASLWRGGPRRLMKGARLIISSPYKMRSLEMRLGEPEKTTWIKEWPEVVEELRNHHGPGSTVAVIPDGTSCIPMKAIEALR